MYVKHLQHMQEFAHEDYARALMESPARGRLQFPDAPQPLALEYSRGRPGGAHGEAPPVLLMWRLHVVM